MTIKLANTPQYCAACFNQRGDIRHVDFDAAMDRGYGKDEAVKVTMDDAIICENCVKEGAELLGMINAEAWQKEKRILENRAKTAESRTRQAERFSETLEDLAMQRGVKIDNRRRPKEREPVG